jgi:hypothetical protein
MGKTQGTIARIWWQQDGHTQGTGKEGKKIKEWTKKDRGE